MNPSENPSNRPNLIDGKPPEDSAIVFNGPGASPVIPAPEAAVDAHAGASVNAALGGSDSPLEIKWFDEDHPPEAGHLFAEAPPEPPPQPFEIVHDPKPAQTQESDPQSTDNPQRANITRQSFIRSPQSKRPPLWLRLIWGFMPLILLVAGYASVIMTQKGIGYSWDEAYYYEPAQKAADWLVEVLRGNHPFDMNSVNEYWEPRHEHPSIQKILSGITLRTFSDPKLQVWAMRLPIAILFGLTLSLIYLLGRRVWGPVPGVIAALLYLTMPRIFGHAHFAAMETPLNFLMLMTVFCFLRGLDYPFWSVMTGIAFGLTLATKINGFFLPIPLILWAHVYARQRYVNNLFAMLTLGPLCFLLAWPWLWHDSILRFLNYIGFHAQHQLTKVFFMGQVWGDESTMNAPWYYPAMIVAATLPLTAIVLSGLGAVRTLLALTRRPIGALYLMCALVMLAVASAPGTPKYDGERLFMPVFPFLALLGGSGAVGLIGRIQGLILKRNSESPQGRQVWRWTALALMGIIVLDGGSAIWRYHPYLLSYFNPLVGGLRGVYQNGLFETTYWGEAVNDEVIQALNDLPSGSSIKPLAMHEKCLQDLQNWGVLNADLRIDQPKHTLVGGRTVEYFDYHLLQMRQGFFKRPEKALAESARYRQSGTLWGWGGKRKNPGEKMNSQLVPLVGLYKTGPEFEFFWQGIPFP